MSLSGCAVAGGDTGIRTRAEPWRSPALCSERDVPSGVWCLLGTLGFAEKIWLKPGKSGSKCLPHSYTRVVWLVDGISILKFFILRVCFTVIVKTPKWFTGIRVLGTVSHVDSWVSWVLSAFRCPALRRGTKPPRVGLGWASTGKAAQLHHKEAPWVASPSLSCAHTPWGQAVTLEAPSLLRSSSCCGQVAGLATSPTLSEQVCSDHPVCVQSRAGRAAGRRPNARLSQGL